MSETPNESAKFRIEDLIDNNKNIKNNNNKNNSSNDIPKNQKVFGHNKRIKP